MIAYKILFGTKYFGKSIDECPSGFLVWILESYSGCDFLLREACKAELSHRISIDFTPATPEQKQIDTLTDRVRSRDIEIQHLKDVLLMSIFPKWNYYKAEMYLNYPALLKSDLEIIRETQSTN